MCIPSSKASQNALPKLAGAYMEHSFKVAVSLFKAGITLELTRRENEDKVIALNIAMCDMMQTLAL